jgi:general secretion pathway protein D
VDLRGNVIKSLVPVTQTRELESVLRVSSGQTAVLGGLMLDSFVGHRDGIPIASRIPFFGDFVSFRNDTSTKSELVIFIRPMVIRDASLEGDLAAYRSQFPARDFFSTTEPPYPRVQRQIERLENLGMPKPAPDVRAVPIVPDAPPPAPPR